MRVLSVFALRIFYQFLKMVWWITKPITVGVRVLMVKDGCVLLVHHSYQNAWFMPGGAVKRGETLEQAALREVFEETRAVVNDLRFIGTYTSFTENKSDHISFFISEDFLLPELTPLSSEGNQTDIEIDQVRSFPIENLPENTAPGQARHIAEFHANPNHSKTRPGSEW